jgi:hypothetical protein
MAELSTACFEINLLLEDVHLSRIGPIERVKFREPVDRAEGRFDYFRTEARPPSTLGSLAQDVRESSSGFRACRRADTSRLISRGPTGIKLGTGFWQLSSEHEGSFD